MTVMFTWYNRITDLMDLALLSNNCQLKLGKVHRVNGIGVILGLRVL